MMENDNHPPSPLPPEGGDIGSAAGAASISWFPPSRGGWWDDVKQARIGCLKWHCRRALLELDLVFQRFWSRHGDDLDEETGLAMSRLLALEDHDLWNLINGHEETRDPQINRIVTMLRQLDAAPDRQLKTLST